MREQLDRVLEPVPDVRADGDPEAVHRMRVAIRRLRTAIKLFGPHAADRLDTQRLEALGEALRGLARALGRVRDEDVLARTLRAAAAPGELPAVERLLVRREGARADARAALLTALDGDEMVLLGGSFAHSLDLALAAEPKAPPRAMVRRAGPRLIADALKKLRRSGRRLVAPTSPALHRTRILAKRLRYAGEFLAPAFGPTLPTTVRTAQGVQDALGALHDDDAALGVLLDAIAAGLEPDDAAALGCVAQRLRARRDDHLAAFDQLWAGLPKPRKLRARLEEEAR